MFLSLQYPCVQFHETLKISFQFQPCLMSIKTCPITSKGSGVLSIKFTKNVPYEVGIRGVKKNTKMNKKSITILNILDFNACVKNQCS